MKQIAFEELAQDGVRRETVPDPSGGARRTLCACLVTMALTAAPGFAQTCRDLKLTNGRIVTLDKQNTIATTVTIHDGVFVDASTKLAACARTINLRGRTVT